MIRGYDCHNLRLIVRRKLALWAMRYANLEAAEAGGDT
jgi:hypothetical protein